jgi:hypothetical protein
LHVYFGADWRLSYHGAGMPVTKDEWGNPGLKLESASAVVAKDMMAHHLGQYSLVIRGDRRCGQDTAGAYISGLAGVLALNIAAGHGSREEIEKAAIEKLRECITRDLHYIKQVY